MMQPPPTSGAEKGSKNDSCSFLDLEIESSWDLLLDEADAIQPYFTSDKESSPANENLIFRRSAWDTVPDAGLQLEKWEPDRSPAAFLIDTGTKQEPFKISMASSQLAKFALRNKILPELLPLMLPDNRIFQESSAGDVLVRHYDARRGTYPVFAFSFYCCLGTKPSDVRRITVYHQRPPQRPLWMIFGDCRSIRDMLMIRVSVVSYCVKGAEEWLSDREDAQQYRLVTNMFVCGWRGRLRVLESQLKEAELYVRAEDNPPPSDLEAVLRKLTRSGKEILDVKMQMQTCLRVLQELSDLNFFTRSDSENSIILLKGRIARAEYMSQEAQRITGLHMFTLTQTHRSQVERIGWNSLKVNYVLQALLRLPTVAVVVFLPGLFVSSIIVLGDISVWLMIALPLTVFVVLIATVLYRTQAIQSLESVVRGFWEDIWFALFYKKKREERKYEA